jgi:hypothetical protein
MLSIKNYKQITESCLQVRKVLQYICFLAHFHHVLLHELEDYALLAHISIK